jgi:hypothetical protein
MLSSQELYELIDSTSDIRSRQIANCLLIALNDWPTTNLIEPKELIIELKESINGKLTFEKLSIYMNGLDPIIDSWKMEALSSIIEMFDSVESRDKDELETIISRLSGGN